MSDTTGHTRALIEGGIFSVLAVFLTIIGIYVPIFQAVTAIINALPIIIFVALRGVKKGITASLVAAILIVILTGPLNGLLFFIGVAPVALVLGWSFRERKALAGITLGAVAGFLGFLIVIGVGGRFLNIDMLADYGTMISQIGDAILAVKQRGADTAGLSDVTQMVSALQTLMMIVLPMTLFMMSLITSFVNFWLTRVILRKMGQQVEDFPPFRQWDIPRAFFYGWGLSLAAWRAGSYYFGAEALTFKFGLNCFVFFSVALLLQGMAVLSFFLAKYNVPKILRILIAIAALSIPLLYLMVLYAGGLDMFTNFRRLQRGEDK